MDDSQEYLTLRVDFPDTSQRVFGDAFRGQLRELARKHANAGTRRYLPPALFHKTEDEKARGSAPAIRFGGGKGCGRIHAIGAEAADFLEGLIPRVVRLLSEETGQFLHSQTQTGRVGVRTRNQIQAYRVPNLIIQKPGKRHELMHASKEGRLDNATVAPYVEGFLRRGIHEQANILGTDYDPDFLVDDIGFAYATPVPLHYKDRQAALMLRDVRLVTNLHLEGPWHIGFLRSRGFGYITRPRKADAKTPAA